MPTDKISLTQRLTQANTRLSYICRQWYLRQMKTQDFKAERKDILDFIEQSYKEQSEALKSYDLPATTKPTP